MTVCGYPYPPTPRPRTVTRLTRAEPRAQPCGSGFLHLPQRFHSRASLAPNSSDHNHSLKSGTGAKGQGANLETYNSLGDYCHLGEPWDFLQRRARLLFGDGGRSSSHRHGGCQGIRCVRTAAAVTPRRRIMSKVASGRFRSNLFTVTNKNKPAMQMTIM